MIEPNNVYLGDCLELMKDIPDKSVNSSEVVTEIIDKYNCEGYTLRHLADLYKTNHHKIKRILLSNGIEITRRKTLKKFTVAHKQKISETRKKMKENGWTPHNKGLKVLELKNGKELLYKNMFSHLRFNIKLTWLMKFEDFEKLKCLNRAISNRDNRFNVTSDWYIRYIEKFYNDAQFNKIYSKWIKNKNDRYLLPTLDHIIPKSKGGSNDLENFQFLSWFENKAKDNLSLEQWNLLKSNIDYYLV